MTSGRLDLIVMTMGCSRTRNVIDRRGRSVADSKDVEQILEETGRL
jgi:hypothetical protein